MPMFQCTEPSQALVNAMAAKHEAGVREKKHIRPAMVTSLGLFTMRTSDISPEEMAKQRELAAEGTKPPQEVIRGRPKAPNKANSSYAERYYWALLDAERAREELKQTQVQEEEDTDLGVKPLEGKFEIQLELVVNRAPDVSDSEDESQQEEKKEEEEKLEESDEDSSAFDAAAELSALQNELAVMDAKDNEIRKKAEAKEAARRKRAEEAARKAAEERRRAEELARQKAKEEKAKQKAKEGKDVPSFNDVPNSLENLSRGGTIFFAPDAERLAVAPSLPPPPPPSQYGRHLMKMKPRLPLDISWNRYRDEQVFHAMPDGITEAEMTRRVAEKVRTVDFWAGCKVAAMRVQKEKDDRLKRQMREGVRKRADAKHWEDRVGKHVTEELRKSKSWMSWRTEDTAQDTGSPKSDK